MHTNPRLSFPSTSFKARRTIAVGAFLASALGLLARDARAQILFSIDYRGPSNATPVPCAPGIVGAGDILSVLPGAFCAPDSPLYGPIPGPDLVMMGGPGGLGVISIGGCVGAPPGVLCPRELDALSLGFDPFLMPGFLQAGQIVFSVDEWALGIAGTPLAPNVAGESPFGDSAADVFEALVLPPYPAALPVPVAMIPGNTGLVDGNGLVSPSTAHYPGVGILEPRPAFAGPGARPGDNLDALDMDPPAVGPALGFFYSLDGTIFDPAYGTPGLGTAQANGFLPGMVLWTPVPGGAPIIYAMPPVLGLDLFGPGRDDLDALVIAENGVAGYQPSPGAYAWGGAAGPDMLLFSVRRGSAVIGMIASGPIAAPIEPGDILIPPAAIGLPPQIFIPAEYLGLLTARSFPVPPWGGDDLDALDTRRPPATGVGYCHGDGDSIPCPCLNTGAPGNGCANSLFPAGGALTGTGLASVSADSVSLNASNLTGATCVFFQGASSIPPIAVDDGIGCVGGPVVRLGTKAVVANTSSYPTGLDPSVSVKGLLPAIGGTRYYQCFYRNAVAAFCPPATSNRTNGFVIVWGP